MIKKGWYLGGIILTFWSSLTYAKDVDFQFSGFASLGITHNNSDELQFHRDFTQKLDDEWSFTTDSLLAGQVNIDFSQDWDAVVQVIYQDRVSDKLNDYVEWAFIRRKFGRNWSVRGGRIAADMYLLSEYKSVGYAYPWVRPPTEFYSPTITISQVDGLDIEYSTNILKGFLQAKLAYGRTDAQMSVTAESFGLKFDELIASKISYSQDNWKIRASLARVEIDEFISRLQELIEGIDNVPSIFWPEAEQIVSGLSHQNHHIHYVGLGYQYDSDNWLIQAELGSTISEWYLLPSYKNGYVSVGYNTGDFTYYSSLSDIRPRDDVRSIAPP